MRRLEEVLHDLAEQDERLPTNELITRIERRLSGESDVPVVVEARLEMDTHSDTPRTQRRRWAPVAVAAGAALLVLLAVGLPVLLLSGDESIVAEPSTTTVASTTVVPTTTPPTTVQPTPTAPAEVVPFPPSELAVLEVPLSEAVPGFSDTIVMRTWSGDGDGVMRWRSSESMTEVLLPPENGMVFGDLDASARWVSHENAGVVQAVPTVPGEPSQREIVGYDAPGGVVWHDTEPGHLAWLECPYPFDGPTTLFTLDVSDPLADPIRVRSFDQGCWLGSRGVDEPFVALVGWGSTGVWATKSEGQDVIESVLVDVDGAETAMVSDARMIAMSPDGTSVWQSDNREGPHFVLSPDGQQRSPVPGPDDYEHLGVSWWSPDGTRLAMWIITDGDGPILRTVDSVSGEVITEIAEPALDAWGPMLAWSTDSRFLVYKELPFPQDPDNAVLVNAVLVIHDTATNTTTKIPLTQDVGDIRLR
jgi:hypothetical protein